MSAMNNQPDDSNQGQRAQTEGAAPGFIEATWPAPEGVHAGVSTRVGGESRAPYVELNLSFDVGDHPDAVERNRVILANWLNLPASPIWPAQEHGTRVARIDGRATEKPLVADGLFTDQPNTVLAVLTADCLSVCLVSHDGQELAVVHAGWRGLAAGVIEAALAEFSVPADQIIAWLGPAIGPEHFVVGADVRQAFMQEYPSDAVAFSRHEQQPGKYHADLFMLARARLNRQGLTRVYGGERCTAAQPELFYSYRRDQGKTGRMATLIWRE